MLQNVVGAQLFTVRDFIKDLPNLRETFKKVAAIGYKVVQLSGQGPIDPKDIVQAADENGLAIVATHANWNRFLNELEALIEEHKILRCRHLAVGSIPKDYRSLEGLQRFIDELTPICERLGQEGMTFSYHNHDMEFAKFEGKTWLERLYAGTDPAMLKAELDVHWVQRGGGDPVQWICRCAGRQPLLHLKDFVMSHEREPRFAEIGEGNMNWTAILQAAQESGVEYYLVEQDQCYGSDPFECLATSYRNLKAMGLS